MNAPLLTGLDADGKLLLELAAPSADVEHLLCALNDPLPATITILSAGTCANTQPGDCR